MIARSLRAVCGSPLEHMTATAHAVQPKTVKVYRSTFPSCRNKARGDGAEEKEEVEGRGRSGRREDREEEEEEEESIRDSTLFEYSMPALGLEPR